MVLVNMDMKTFSTLPRVAMELTEAFTVASQKYATNWVKCQTFSESFPQSAQVITDGLV